ANGTETVTVADLAADKKLPAEFLCNLGLEDVQGGVGIPYYGETGEPIAVKKRTHLVAKRGSRWPGGVQISAYGQWRLDQAAKVGFLILVEGESDCWVLWYHGLPALGIPGADATKCLNASFVEAI